MCEAAAAASMKTGGGAFFFFGGAAAQQLAARRFASASATESSSLSSDGEATGSCAIDSASMKISMLRPMVQALYAQHFAVDAPQVHLS